LNTLTAFTIDDLPLPGFMLSESVKITAVNELAIDLLGYQANELIGEPFELLFVNEQLPQRVNELQATNIEQAQIEHVILKNKTQKMFNASVQISQREGDILVLLLSSSPRENDEQTNISKYSDEVLVEQLKQQSRYLTLTEKTGGSGHWRIDLASDSVFWSPGIYQIHGVDESFYKPTLNSMFNFYITREREKFSQLLKNSLEKKERFYFKSFIVRASGVKVKIESTGEVELDDSGQVKSIFGVFRDITKREDTLEKLKLLAMVNYTIKLQTFFINESDNAVYQDIAPQYGDDRSNLFAYLNLSISEYSKFKKLARSKGNIKRINISFDKFLSVFDLFITYESDTGVYIWIVENVTDKFHLEQQQIISSRLALLGNTFGSVSHDINNVLGVALGSIEMLELKYSQGETDISSYIKRVKNAIDKGKSVTERLLAFTRKPRVKIVSFDPIQEIRENKYLFKQLLLINIEIKYDIDNVDCNIHFPQGEFINILLNLVLNAQDAIQDQGLSGKIIIKAKLVDENRLEIHVIDSGVGIADENLTKIFDPFYSSKSVNKGNGIGLANVFNTMYKHNGHIQVEGSSKLGGAHFILVFKCSIGSKPQALIKKKNHINIKGKRILVLDDEVSIAEFVGLHLESLGAHVICVNNREDLNKQIMANEDIDVFITDMIMPDLSGMEAVNIVKSKFYQVKVFSMSGYIAVNNDNWHYPVLHKPFNSKELVEFLTE